MPFSSLGVFQRKLRLIAIYYEKHNLSFCQYYWAEWIKKWFNEYSFWFPSHPLQCLQTAAKPQNTTFTICIWNLVLLFRSTDWSIEVIKFFHIGRKIMLLNSFITVSNYGKHIFAMGELCTIHGFLFLVLVTAGLERHETFVGAAVWKLCLTCSYYISKSNLNNFLHVTTTSHQLWLKSLIFRDESCHSAETVPIHNHGCHNRRICCSPWGQQQIGCGDASVGLAPQEDHSEV